MEPNRSDENPLALRLPVHNQLIIENATFVMARVYCILTNLLRFSFGIRRYG
jgi:hypothetical protein